MRYLTFLFAFAIALGFCPQAHADSFSDVTDAYKVRHVPVMQYGRYDPSAAPRPEDVPEMRNKRPCCREGGPPRWYFGATGLVVFLRDEDVRFTSSIPLSKYRDTYTTKTGFGFGGEIGYRITPSIRAEIEAMVRMNDLDKINGQIATIPNGKYSAQKSVTYMFNGYYDFVNASNFTPYLGAGLGMAYVRAPIYYPNASQFLKEWTLAYQFMTGISYEIDTGMTPVVLNFGYRYLTGRDPETKFKNFPVKATYFNNSHNLEVGAKLYF